MTGDAKRVVKLEDDGRAVEVEVVDAGDIDLDAEEVLLPDGTRLTEAVAEELVEEVHARRPGRPKLSGGQQGPAPTARFRASEELVNVAKRRAAAEHRPVSDLYREAVERYLRAS